MARLLKILSILAVAGSLLGLGSAGLAMAATATPARPAGSPGLKSVMIPVSSRPRLLRKSHGVFGSDATIVYEIVNYDGNFCLDANDAGPTAGQNGDKVQLWTCRGTNNQYWERTSLGTRYFILRNVKYPSKCLNADDAGGLKDGRKVQLWNCSVNTSNEYWGQGGRCAIGSYGFYCPLGLEAGNGRWVLDAVAQHIGKGDQVQIWNYNGHPNQLWALHVPNGELAGQ